MPWIRIQGLKTDGNGKITAGTASIVDTEYVKGGKNHSRQITREKLGRPLSLSDDGRSGIFRSADGGIVSYDADTDSKSILEMDDPRLEGLIETADIKIHTVFGDGYLFLNCLKNIGLTSVLKKVIPDEKDFRRIIAHLFHGIMRNGSNDRCDHFVRKSFVGRLPNGIDCDSLVKDTRYYDILGNDDIGLAFCKTFVNIRRSANPEFGKCCYADSLPLPDDICDNPFDSFTYHGESIQCRLVLITDIHTGEPVWFRIVPSRNLGVNTMKNITDEAKTELDIQVCEYVLGEKYANELLICAYGPDDEKNHITPTGKKTETVMLVEDEKSADDEIPLKTMTVKMPNRDEYRCKDMFESVKDLLIDSEYDFRYDNRTYFGKRGVVYLFNRRIYAYIYIDYTDALTGYRDLTENHEDDFGKLGDDEKTWRKYSSGFFVLLSNIRESPKEMLGRYFGRSSIEKSFKTSAEYLDMLPLKEWNPRRINGKILSDMISSIIRMNMNKKLRGTRVTPTEVPTITQSLMCSIGKDDVIRIDPPNSDVRKIYKAFGIALPNRIDMKRIVSEYLS